MFFAFFQQVGLNSWRKNQSPRLYSAYLHAKVVNTELGLFFFVLLVGDWSQIRKQLRSTPTKTIFFPFYTPTSQGLFIQCFIRQGCIELFLLRAKHTSAGRYPRLPRPQGKGLNPGPSICCPWPESLNAQAVLSNSVKPRVPQATATTHHPF